MRFQGFRTDVRDQLPGYRAYVHAAYAETSSLAIIEAMAAGLPIVAIPSGRCLNSMTRVSRAVSGLRTILLVRQPY